MAKAKKVDKSKERRALKYFTGATVSAVDAALIEITVEDLITNIYLKSDDKDITYFIKQYEKQLVLSKVNHELFDKGLHQFYLDMTTYIKANSLYKKFFELSYLQNIALCKKRATEGILTAYQDLVIQTYPYLTGTSKKVAYGVDKRGKLMMMPEVGTNLTEINYDLHLLVISKEFQENSYQELDYEELMLKIFKQYGYKVKEKIDCQEIIVNDQVITNMLYFMAVFINDDTKCILPIPYRQPMKGVNANSLFEVEECNSLIREKLVQRQFLLPSEGVNARFENCGDVKGLYLLEVIENDTIVLLFKVQFLDGTYTSGYYDTATEIFYDMWKESNHAAITHIPLVNIVLQNYLNLTCNLTKEERNELFWFKEIKDINNTTIDLFKGSTVYYEIKEHSVKGTTTHTRHFDRSKYIAELMNIQPFLRRLPSNYSPGQEAIEVAKKLGIELPKGMTLVRGFLKKVYTSEK